MQVVLRFLILDEPHLCSKEKSAKDEAVEDLNAAYRSKICVLVNQLSMFVEALVGDCNSPFDFFAQVSREMRCSAQVEVLRHNIHLVGAILSNRREETWSIRSKNLSLA